MFKFYPILFFRNLKRYKKFYFISFFIFIVAFTAFLANRIISDGYYNNHNMKVYRVFSNPQTSGLLLRNFDDDIIMPDDYVELLNNFDEIKGVLEYRIIEDISISNGRNIELYSSDIHFANDVIFDIYLPYFKYYFEGFKSDEIIISDSLALELGIDKGDLIGVGGLEYKVANVFEKQNDYALFNYDLLLDIDLLEKYVSEGELGDNGKHIFVLLDSDDDYQRVNKEVNVSGSFDSFLYFMDIRVNNFYGMKSILKTDNSNFIDILMNLSYLLFILSALSYIILNMSFSSNKLKELGIRKLFGATKLEIFLINIFETVFISMISSLFSIVIVYFFIDSLVFEVFGFDFWILYFLMGIIIGFSAGFYSAFILAKKEIDDLLRSLLRVGVRGYFYRKMLLILQYSLAVFISIYCINSYNQFELLGEHKYTNNKVNWVKIDLSKEIELNGVLLDRIKGLLEGNDKVIGFDVEEEIIKVGVTNLGLVNTIEEMKSELLGENGFGVEGVSLMNADIESAIKFDIFIKNQLFLMMTFVILLSLIITYVFSEYMTKERKKEISIRKILGARTFSIYLLFQKEMVVITLNSIIIAWVVSFFPLRAWINQFIYQYKMSIFDYLNFSIVTLLLVVFTVSLPIIKYAKTDPAEVLRQ